MTSTVGRGPLQRLRSATSLTSLRRREDGIHVLLESFQVAWNVVQHRLHRNPAEVRQRDEWGRTVLYHAISRRVDDSPPVSLVEYLVEVFPEAVHRDTNGGRCPLHAACHRRAPLPVLQAFMRSRDGEVSDCLALCAFHDSYCKLFGESALVSFISEGDGKEACSILIRLELLLRYCASTGQEGTVDEWFPIHTAAALPYCSVGILEIFLNVYPIQRPDPKGRLPLHHCVASRAVHDEFLGIQKEERERCLMERLQLILERDMSAVQKPDMFGALPLHLASIAGQPTVALELLTQAWPAALRSPYNGFVPVLLAASSSVTTLDQVFYLLHAAPDVLRL